MGEGRSSYLNPELDLTFRVLHVSCLRYELAEPHRNMLDMYRNDDYRVLASIRVTFILKSVHKQCNQCDN